MFFRTLLSAAFVAGATFLPANAGTVHFDVAGSPASSVNAGVDACLCFGGVSANLVDGLDDEAFTLNTGEHYEFDFIEWSLSGLGFGTYEVSATLAFETPGGSASSDGGGGFARIPTFFGVINAGGLEWDDPSQTVQVGGFIYDVEFEEGKALWKGKKGTVISGAKVTLVKTPLPATGLMLLGGLAGLGVLRRRAK